MKLQIKFESEYCIDDYLTKTGADKSTIKYKHIREELGHLVGMPRYVKERAEIANTKIDVDDLEGFKSKYGLVCKSRDKTLWWNFRKGRYTDCYYTDDTPQHPSTPIYILSKGRYDCCKTANSLLEMGLTDFKIIVELDEWNKYAEVYGEGLLLLLTQEYKDNTVLESTHERATMSTGSIPARNFAWEYSMSLGHEYHIVLDDNICGFVRYAPGNWRIPIKTPTLFKIWEDITTQSNVAMSGLNYRFFNAGNRPIYTINTRCYSMVMIKNSLWNEGIKWRVSRNEDTVLSLDILEKGHTTLLLNNILGNKMATQQLKGGNTSEFYLTEGTDYKTQVLKNEYPDVVQTITRYGRIHHYIDYVNHYNSRFEPIFKINSLDPEYGLYLKSDKRANFCPQCLI